MIDVRKYIDNAALKPHLSEKEIEEFVLKSEELGIYAVCVNPYHVKLASSIAKKVKVCCVIGFPLGLNKTSVKVKEAVEAVRDGAQELDIVWNLSAFKSEKYDFVVEELKEIFRETPSAVHKVIVETPYLNEEEIKKAVEICIEAGADFIKTSTGFAPRGTTLEEVRLIKSSAKGRIKVKASGGIRDLETAISMIEAGADRIGTSSGISIAEEFLKRHLI
ncbi:deoxyribose-phosphate aldolase [Aquifex aeolicus]|uniref:Deoxyribose-phosphate aldolase n=2 Tax=Aquifex aeolicus TaxID=63363 RepID=DEOC_AQUAE|nr:deoxyribose-phosphate aldolase [Aquifex aeolicus]O66540.1 RecName: Full=Deoxyribose-phosphate aldolase; Short=DERA; AltName: Full=2-deoxy-D-ribose 5-phosphate aldolase; AltName: Full=Phosphodeoxyriboaldolase; Short=Deoxyriboaldolase [Aquifex aeolicus VF5]AAC06495.1 deoxyribose-phosphate aldolase [Aquifex aeolicus VF5]